MKPDMNKGHLLPAVPHLQHIITRPLPAAPLQPNVTQQRRKNTHLTLCLLDVGWWGH